MGHLWLHEHGKGVAAQTCSRSQEGGLDGRQVCQWLEKRETASRDDSRQGVRAAGT
jgi:hypothetical protein